MSLEHFRFLEMRQHDDHQEVYRVLSLLEAALDFRGRAVIPVVIAPPCCFGSRVLGRYVQRSRHVELCAASEHLMVTTLHEVGHSLDHLQFEDFASESLLPNWTKAIITNPCLARLNQNVSEGRIRRTSISAPELFARSFEQWCIQRLLFDPTLQRQWKAFLSGQDLIKEGSYWSNDEFGLIADAFEQDLSVLGIALKSPEQRAQIRSGQVQTGDLGLGTGKTQTKHVHSGQEKSLPRAKGLRSGRSRK